MFRGGRGKKDGENVERRSDERQDSADSTTRDLKVHLHERVLREMVGRPGYTRAQAEARVREIIDTELALTRPTLRRGAEKEALVESLLDDIFGLGAIQRLIDDETISEIMVNGPRDIYVERNGRIYPTNVRFDSVEHEMSVIDRIVAQVGRRVDESSPMADARLPDGSRINVVLPPLVVGGPVVTIRKFRLKLLSVEELIATTSATKSMLDFLAAAVKGRQNILVTGGSSSGKTTLLNVLSGFIGESERIVTIEDAAELRLQQKHVVSMETRQPNSEGRGTVTIRDLVRNSMRMRPDRIIVGEVRGPEALDMIQAMNTDHDGGMSTLHANGSEDALQRLETMALMAGVDLPSAAMRFQICSAITLVAHTERVSGGARKIVDISEVLRDAGELHVQPIFSYLQEGVDAEGNAIGHHEASGIIPHCLTRIRARGVVVDSKIFARSKTKPAQTKATRANTRTVSAVKTKTSKAKPVKR